jgi:hypothetical protein
MHVVGNYYCVLISVQGARVFAMRVAPELRAHYLLNIPSNTRTLCPSTTMLIVITLLEVVSGISVITDTTARNP